MGFQSLSQWHRATEDRIRLLAGGVTSLREDLVRVSFDIGRITLMLQFTAPERSCSLVWTEGWLSSRSELRCALRVE